MGCCQAGNFSGQMARDFVHRLEQQKRSHRYLLFERGTFRQSCGGVGVLFGVNPNGLQEACNVFGCIGQKLNGRIGPFQQVMCSSKYNKLWQSKSVQLQIAYYRSHHVQWPWPKLHDLCRHYCTALARTNKSHL